MKNKKTDKGIEDAIAISQQIDAHLKSENYGEAMIEAEKLVSMNRSPGLAYKGLVHLRKNELDFAEAALVESYQLNPKQHLALVNLIPVYLKKRDFKKAVAFGEEAYKIFPKNESVAINYAAALMQEQKYDQSLAIFNSLYDEKSPKLPILSGLISCYRSLFQTEKSDELLAFAERLFPDSQELVRLRADTFAERDPKNALSSFEKALKNSSDNVALKWNMSLVQLRLHKFDQGWSNYDNGLKPEVGKIGRPMPTLFNKSYMITDPNELDPMKWTIVVVEQGIGDQVLFFGCFREFLIDYPKTILISEKRMRSILSRSFSSCLLYPYGFGPLIDGNIRNTNGFIPLGCIQKKYRPSVDSYISNQTPYLIPDQEKTEKYRSKLLQKTGNKQLVGISWKGGYWERAQKTKTLELDYWESILQLKDYIFVSLQYGDVEREKNRMQGRYENLKWIDGIDFKADLDSWFALACACDRVVSVSTALVHFVGAAGKKVDLLLSDRGAPFIWGLEEKKAIAYRDITIHRKTPEVTIQEFFKSVANRIKHETL
ncbi:MAG: hypothetical protein FJY58_07725 [Betaproteobacteria bacterium]|nr:hypothetical protein [Betaproteobacteria bacterium]